MFLGHAGPPPTTLEGNPAVGAGPVSKTGGTRKGVGFESSAFRFEFVDDAETVRCSCAPAAAKVRDGQAGRSGRRLLTVRRPERGVGFESSAIRWENAKNGRN